MSSQSNNHYIGRFAPSPTGDLHLGSLVAAVGSYIRAKNKHGDWLVRMEDLDPLREIPGAAQNILQTLQAHGLQWDGEVVYQSQRQALYTEALEYLIEKEHVYVCTCSRKFLKRTAKTGQYGVIYPETCRHLNYSFDLPNAIRVRTNDDLICFQDGRRGKQCQNLKREVGDFIIKRSDGYFAYQLAVVVDDEAQGVTEIVRGEDLLSNTQRQIHLQRLLGYQQPEYYHLPMVVNSVGQKLSKQTYAAALQNNEASSNLIQALAFLGIYNSETDTPELIHESPAAILQWSLCDNNGFT